MAAINASIDFDKRLYAEDIAGSKAHAAMLVRRGIISDEDDAAINRVWSRSRRDRGRAASSSAPRSKTST